MSWDQTTSLTWACLPDRPLEMRRSTRRSARCHSPSSSSYSELWYPDSRTAAGVACSTAARRRWSSSGELVHGPPLHRRPRRHQVGSVGGIAASLASYRVITSSASAFSKVTPPCRRVAASNRSIRFRTDRKLLVPRWMLVDQPVRTLPVGGGLVGAHPPPSRPLEFVDPHVEQVSGRELLAGVRRESAAAFEIGRPLAEHPVDGDRVAVDVVENLVGRGGLGQLGST